MTEHVGTETLVADPRRWRRLALLAAAQFVLVLDVTVVAVALPAMATDLGLSREALTWVVGGYALAFGGLLLLGGRAADVFGSRTVVLLGLAVFTGASLVTGLAAGPEMLIAGRVAQGVGAALLSPAALSVVVRTFDGDERNRALGVWSALGGSGAAVGVLLGGVLTAGPGWPWVFFVNVPVGLLVLVALSRLLPVERPAPRRAPLDVPGALLVTVGTGAAVYGTIELGATPMPGPLVPLAAALALYVAFVARQRTARAPLMDLALLLRRPVAAGLLLILAATALTISMFFVGTFYLQQLRGHGPLVTGLLFLPVALGTMSGAQLAGRTIGQVGARLVTAAGFALTALGIALPALVDATSALVAGLAVASVGLGALFVSASATALGQVDAAEAGLASGLLSTFHEFGAALGVAATSSLAAASLTGTGASGFIRAFSVTAVAAVIVGLLCLGLIPARPRVRV